MSGCPEGRSCDWCGPSARVAHKLAQAPTVAHDADDTDEWVEGYEPDDYEADDDGKCHTEPLRVPLIEIARVA